MLSVLRVELMKMRWLLVGVVLVVGPALTLVLGDPMRLEWEMYYSLAATQYAWLYYPLLAGVLSALVCRTEHVSGGWKSLLGLPVKRAHVYQAKLLIVVALLAVSQVIFLGTTFVGGSLKGVTGAFPWAVIGRSLLLGWLAVLPIAALQMWASTRWKAFGSALALNVVLTLPAIFAVQSDKVGPWYPWAQPFRAMLSGMSINDTGVDLGVLAIIVVAGFVAALVGGMTSFARSDVVA